MLGGRGVEQKRRERTYRGGQQCGDCGGWGGLWGLEEVIGKVKSDGKNKNNEKQFTKNSVAFRAQLLMKILVLLISSVNLDVLFTVSGLSFTRRARSTAPTSLGWEEEMKICLVHCKYRNEK